MKKLILAALLAACGAGTALAQTTQGSKVVSGNIGFSTYESDNTNYHDVLPQTHKYAFTSVYVGPAIGYLLRDGLEAGMNLGFSYSSTQRQSSNNNTSYTEKYYGGSISPYLRKYFQVSDKLMFHGTGKVTAGIAKNLYNQGENESTNKSTTLGISGSPGLTYFVTEKFGISTTFGTLRYNRNYNTPENWPKTVHNDFAFDLSLSSVMFGLNYFISR